MSFDEQDICEYDDPDIISDFNDEPFEGSQVCLQCNEEYVYSDQSPDYVKAGYCSRGCAEDAGYFKRKVAG